MPDRSDKKPALYENVERGFFVELGGNEATAERVVNSLWSNRGNRRKLTDGLVVREAFDAEEVLEFVAEVPLSNFIRRVDGKHPKYQLGRFVKMVTEINRLLGAPHDNVYMYRTPIDGIDAHIGCDSVGEYDNCRRSSGVVYSLGLLGQRYIGLSPILRHWTVLDADVFNEAGKYPQLNEMRSAICQNPGDIVMIPGGVVHMVVADAQSSAVLLAQRNYYQE